MCVRRGAGSGVQQVWLNKGDDSETAARSSSAPDTMEEKWKWNRRPFEKKIALAWNYDQPVPFKAHSSFAC